jgi:hypothetical protein
LPDDWAAVAGPEGVRETVVVEASPLVEDNQWVLDLAAKEKGIVGLVGNLDPNDEAFAANLKRFSANPLFRGVRWRADLVRIDQNRSGTTLYTENAVAAQGLFSLAVEMNGQRYYPIEVSGNLTAGKGGERVRLDLNLGEDTDGDGLPDIWEAWQLYQAGYSPDENGLWPIHLLSRNGDFDKDGLSDWLEYVEGTFAGDATERFNLEIKEKLAASVRFEFYAITGKTYTIERSTDMQSWTRATFSMDAPGAGSGAHRAEDVGIRSAFAAPSGGAEKEFYRLTVR